MNAKQTALVRGLAAQVMCLLSTGCAVEAIESTEELDQTTDELSVKTTVIWTSLSIPVCWENPLAASSTRRDWVKDQVTKTWQNNSQVKFTGWGTCTAASKGIRIKIADKVASTGLLLGRQLDGVASGMTLNLTMVSEPGSAACAAQHTLEACIRATATHEFGHALGFAHEQLRFDNPTFDCFILGGELGNVYVGTYDTLSIMETCTIQDAIANLSPTDKLGLQAFYGSPAPTGVRKDAILWGSDTIYFLFGKNYTRYTVSLDLPNSYYPAPISGNWGNWPVAYPWSQGVDAIADYSVSKLFLFSGSQYARYDKTADEMDAGYPKNLPGGWGNWPVTWTSVDAAIKWTNGKLYLFRGSDYVRLTNTTVDAGYPRPIAGNWNIPYTSGFDYAFALSTGKAYFFKGANYVRFDIAANAVDAGYPQPIVGRWPGVTF